MLSSLEHPNQLGYIFGQKIVSTYFLIIVAFQSFNIPTTKYSVYNRHKYLTLANNTN